MPLRDLLLQLNSYPDRTPDWALQAATQLADRFGAQLSGALCQVRIPDVSNFLADRLVGMSDVIAAENARSRANAEQLLAAIASLRPNASGDVPALIDCGPLGGPHGLAPRARAHDLTIVPVYGHPDLATIAEALIFESGRPVLLLPDRGAATHRLEKIIIGWDGSRAAARALADALPLCAAADRVRLVTISGEKALEPGTALADARRHLLAHRIECETRVEAAQGLDAGAALLNHARESEADLLVVGAYGHSRAREFVLGGATRTILSGSQLPVLLSH